jgi:hypothetical protein
VRPYTIATTGMTGIDCVPVLLGVTPGVARYGGPILDLFRKPRWSFRRYYPRNIRDGAAAGGRIRGSAVAGAAPFLQ